MYSISTILNYFYLDPHVKVEGKRANVLEAKKKILEVLETRVRVFVLDFHNLIEQLCQQCTDEDMLLHVYAYELFGKSFCSKNFT